MTSRRPMTRSFSGNGRTSSFSEDEGGSSNGRSESRNTYLSNVRPENRSTLCSVMAQLTEDIQPSFETTLKSKAVSENCNVKFTCVVSGYPAPELKWYKDDMEMDRYCGLPKYEIRRNGKTHTLHIYNCTLDDAAIYQVSASNSKGIVSCSGVLEVGTMNEFKIHQRFFAKLKQKAEKKKKDLEDQTKTEDKENVQKEKSQNSPEPPPRKRPVPSLKERPAVKEPEAGEQVGAAAPAPVTSMDGDLEKEMPVETLAKKKMKISNGVDVGVNSGSSGSSGRSHMMGNGGENCYDGGISLAQFLAETLQSQAAEEKQNSPRVEKHKEMSIAIVNESTEKERMQKDREEHEKTLQEEYEREKRREEDFERDKERERSLEMLHTAAHSKHGSEVKHHSKAHKDHDHHNIQASISSMLHTVKDFLFGKSKKDSHDHIESKETEFDQDSIQPPQPETPPSFRLQPARNISMKMVFYTCLPAHKLPPESAEESTGQCVKEAEDDVEAMEVSVGKEMPLSGLQGFTEKGMQNDYNLSPTVKAKEIAQLDDEAKMFEQEQPCVKSSEQLPQMDYASIPVINISCTDDSDAFVNAHDSDTPQPLETPTVPLFVVPPISVTCHESDPEPRQLTHNGRTETETSAATQRGTKHDADNNMTTKSEKSHSGKQNFEEVAEKSIKENTHSLLYEALMPKIGNNGPSFNKTTDNNIVPEILKVKPLKEAKIENSMSVEDPQRNRVSVDRLSSKPPAHPSLSPASLRKFMTKVAPDSDNEAVTAVPVITVGDRQGDKADEDLSGGSTPTSSLSCESSPRLKRRDSLTLIRSATPEELASGARRKIFIPKAKEDGEGAVVGALDNQGKKETPYMSPSQARRAALLQAPTGQNTPPMERRSPLLSRRKATLEVPKVVEETPKEEPVTKKEEKPAEKKPDPLKAPQVIRKIRGEPFPDASGHLKLWCQFFNVLSDSTIKWYRDEEEILQVKRSGGDESQVALAIVLASSEDCGVYGCTISNEYGTDTTDFLLSVDILSEILLRDDFEVGEEIEMTPLLFTKGLADSGSWGSKYFGRIMAETVHIGEGCAHKASRMKVIYGLDPVFDSGSNCIIKVQNPIAYGTKQESNLAERNLEITRQECKVQNMIREYCKIFAAEARVIDNFGCSLEVIPQYLMYRPANSVPYATVEADMEGVFLKYCMMDPKGKLTTRNVTEVEQKCSTFQHWIHQWTHGNLLVTRLDGVETKLTNVRVVTKSKGYQGLTDYGSPEVFEQFLTHHQCNYYCGLLGLRPLKSMDSLQQPTKMKGSRSPLLNRKLGSSSPQLQRKGHSPQMSRKANSSPKVTRKVQETEDNKSDVKPKPGETVDALEMR
ncbi:LOW QUALITY PROTEIN: alpha-protein kinase 3 [Lates calcarifer]|uniref:non-specific serine/threonine protein kinase n=1 Tax=Lates calcarifer TaxID=8187 RepID=A0AAJ8BAK2_LATCA|nr:LOW QUALITY PROTEIN: alpha-protein kinase 3 [Lates calcarifer]